jgi:hypothetical protein
MEHIVGLNSILLSKLPLSLQTWLKGLPLSDYSILLIIASLILSFVLVLSFWQVEDKYEPFEPLEESSPTKEKTVKVKIPNTKKARRGAKKRSNANEKDDDENFEEEKREETTNKAEDEAGWETVKARKLKKKDE